MVPPDLQDCSTHAAASGAGGLPATAMAPGVSAHASGGAQPRHDDPLLRPRPRVALAHDWLVAMRGGDRVLDRLASLFGPTDLFVLCRDRSVEMSPAIEACAIHTSLLDRLPGGAGRMRRWYLPLYPLAVESLRIPSRPSLPTGGGECGGDGGPPFDLVLSTSSAMIKSVRPPRRSPGGPGGDRRPIPHLCYCHSPARYIWSRRDDYRFGSGGLLRVAGLAAFNPILRWYDRRTAGRVTQFIANSTHTAEEIGRCFGREAIVIPPPVRTAYFTPRGEGGAEEEGTRDRPGGVAAPEEPFLLVASALEPYKRIDLAIAAANRLGRRLVVVGTGTQAAYLGALAGPTITMTGYVADADLRALFRRAEALLFPWVEDFGITPVEAMACGCPVIALAGGGARDWLDAAATAPGSPRVAGQTFEDATVEGVVAAIERFDRERASLGLTPATCRASALRFSEAMFDRSMLRAVEAALREAAG